ncbi:MAG TPA: TIGR03000 domain-containing protein, partial [Gemmataceae bacterium]
RLGNFSNIAIENGAEIGLGRSGSGGAGPRRRHWYGADGVAPPQVATGPALIDVRVPAADAEVYFEGTNTRQTGARRMFQSPPVQVGTTYYYKVRAKWKQPDGTAADQEKSVGVRANETTVVDFTPAKPAQDKPLLGAE